MKKIIIALLFLLPCHSAFTKETLYFSCLTENNAKVNVHRTADKSRYIYRFTRNGRVELKIAQPTELVHENSRKYGYYYNSYPHAFSLVFINGNYHYHIAFQDIGLIRDKPDRSGSLNQTFYWVQVDKMQPDGTLNEAVYETYCKYVQRADFGYFRYDD